MSTDRRNLPVIDVSRLARGDLDSKEAHRAIDAIHAAAHDHGFFYIQNHGVTPDEEAALLQLARRFFALPLAEKLAIENVHSPSFRGYTRVGQERTAGQADAREQLDVGRERAPEAAREPLYLRLRGPNQWPRAVPELAPALLRWIDVLDAVSIGLLRALAVALGQPAGSFDDAFLPESDTFVKVIRYPPDGSEAASATAPHGVGAHKDYGFLALLLQDGVGGLEVDDGRGGFAPVPPLPGTMVANLGEMLEVATRGYLRATVHRVVRPAASDRISLAHFFSPRLEATLSPLALAPSLASEVLCAPPDADIHAEFGVNALRGWTRSHPEVTRRHYPELAASLEPRR